MNHIKTDHRYVPNPGGIEDKAKLDIERANGKISEKFPSSTIFAQISIFDFGTQ
jgi:hypothetical protein